MTSSARGTHRLRRGHSAPGSAEDGQLTILIVGFAVIAIALILVGLSATTVQLARIRLFDIADSAALDAADSVTTTAYGSGMGEQLPLTDAASRAATQRYLASVQRPQHVTSWSLMPGTGSPDGHTAVVVLRGVVAVPYVSSFLETFHGRITVTVRSHAQGDITP